MEAVFRSWDSDRARTYRRHEGIPDDLGTGVVVQAMVFGNRDASSGTGVLFTRNPATGERTPYGDFLFGVQGEDVVAGRYATLPVTVLEERMPTVASELWRCAEILERHYRDMCDIEFTIESGRLWLLQVRVGKRSPSAALRMAVEMAEDPEFPLTRAEAVQRVAHLLGRPPVIDAHDDDRVVPLARGLPASPGIATGQIATSSEAAEAAANAGRAVILVRAETSPQDVRGMAHAAGVLTAKGGLVSHAAVVARGWGIPAVVGAAEVEITEGGIVVGGRALACGEAITIDGSSGEVFCGNVATKHVVAPEAAVLLAWANELGLQVGRDAEPGAAPRPAGAGAPVADGMVAAATTSAALSHVTLVTAEDVIRAMLVKGRVTPDALEGVLRAPEDRLRSMLDELTAVGVAEDGAGGFRLTPSGELRALSLFTEDRVRMGGESTCAAALQSFLPLDRRVKGAVTAWQLREVDGESVVNDHGDDAYDRQVVDRLMELHAEVMAWLTPFERVLPRFVWYRQRLQQAAALVRSGDRRFVASPLVDSYHSIWFELHEDLLRLAGQTRAEEVDYQR
jgi:pyruvate,orthophosphate dikinase